MESFIKARMGKVIDMGGCVGPITTFIVEPFVPHAQEYYLCIQSKRLGSDISFSEAGGVEIEENWDKVCLTSNPQPLQTLHTLNPAPFLGFGGSPRCCTCTSFSFASCK